MLRCDPKDPSAEVCDHLSLAKEALASTGQELTSARSKEAFTSARAHRLFAANELKIFGSFIAISVYLGAAFSYSSVTDIGILNQTVGTPPHLVLGPIQLLYLPFGLAVVIHHLRVFLGMSYTDNLDEQDDFSNGGDEQHSSASDSEQLSDEPRGVVALERGLRALCAITFPVFAIFLFRKTPAAVLTVEISWGMQLACIFIYDIKFLKKVIRKSRRFSKSAKIIAVVVSDGLNMLFGAMFVFISLIDEVLSHANGIRADGTLGTAAVLFFPFIIAVAFVPEFIIVYAVRLWKNMLRVGKYLLGMPLDTLQK
jgi:hypothetical protein